MYYSKYIKPIIFALSIIIGILMCAFAPVIADEHSEEPEEAETTSEAEATEEAVVLL